MALFSGLIPALTIKSVSPTNSLKDKVSDKISVKKLRYIFTAFQFCMAVTLIICLLVTNQQLNYLRNKNLGFNKEQLLYIRLDGNLYEKRDALKQSLEQNSNIINTSLTTNSPIGIYWNGGGWEWEGKEEGFDPQVTYIETDNNFQETFGIEMAEGDYFKSTQAGVVINQTFANMIAPGESALGKLLILTYQEVEIPVIGVIKDIHFKPLDRKIGALMFIPGMGFEKMRYLFVKIAPNEMDKTLAFVKNTVRNLNPDFPYEHHFLNDDFARKYKSEERLRNQMTFFSLIAIFISCIGLWGILVFIVNQRIKEIGVRKVNGAKVYQILSMININFLKWIGISILIACPIGWYFMQRWLEKFAYKTTLSCWIFALAGVLALGIAILTVSWQSWRAAMRNPVEALRYE
jgi:putative ABC transport system permease protein